MRSLGPAGARRCALLIGLVLVALLGAAFSFISNAIGIATKSEDALAPMVNTLALPILLLSGILLPMNLAPQWLQIVSDFNPFKHIVEALRAVFRGDFVEPDRLDRDAAGGGAGGARELARGTDAGGADAVAAGRTASSIRAEEIKF